MQPYVRGPLVLRNFVAENVLQYYIYYNIITKIGKISNNTYYLYLPSTNKTLEFYIFLQYTYRFDFDENKKVVFCFSNCVRNRRKYVLR